MGRSANGKSRVFAKVVLALALTGLVAVFAFAAFAAWYLHSGDDVDFSKLKSATQPPKVYAASGELAAYCSENYGYATYDEIPDVIKDAFVAVEDKRYYSHDGIDYIRLAGAALANIRSGSFAEGGSTITQQLAKNVYLSSEKSVSRKLREAQIAVSLEENFSKEQLLEYYLNMLYFGCGEYGVKNAAKRYFGKSLDEVTPLEAAMLAATVKAPSEINPIADFDASLERAKLVLSLMHEQGLIDDNTHNVAQKQEIVIKNELNENSLDKIYVTNALAEAAKILSIDEKELVAKGYSVYTYLDYDKQKALVDSLDGSQCDGIKAALSADVATRAVDAVYADFALDLTAFARQSGSTLKPLAAYAPAFDCGILSPASVLDDSPTDFDGYAPSNYGDVYLGNVSARDALSLSLNVPAVSVLRSVGVDEGASALDRMGIDCGEDPSLSLALGSTPDGISFLSLLGGYVTLASGGNYAPLSLVSAIADSDGNVVYRHNATSCRVFSAETCALVTDCLQDCASDGTAKKLSPLDFDIAAKTGTVGDDNGNHDAYCIAYTPSCAALFWTGSEDYSQYVADTGGGVPTVFAREYFDDVGSGGQFTLPQNVVPVRLDKYDLEQGKLTVASPLAPEYACETELFAEKYVPMDYNSSFDFPDAEDAQLTVADGTSTVTFCADPRLCYRIVKKNFLKKDEILSDICDRDGVVTVSDGTFSPLPSAYAIVPYFLDDNGDEVIGEVVVLRG